MIEKRKFWRVLTRVHKWAGLVIGLQIILWFASGFFMSFFSIDKVHGDHMALEKTWPLKLEQLITAKQALHLYPQGGEIHRVDLRSALGTPIWRISGNAGVIHVDGQKGGLWQGVSEGRIREAAKSYYLGKSQINTVMKLDVAPKDYGGNLPVWQVIFDNSPATRLYISPVTGELINVRTRLWRAFDFMWMLHIMDYKDRSNINLWWLKLVSFCALLFSLSGLGLVLHRVFLRPRVKNP